MSPSSLDRFQYDVWRFFEINWVVRFRTTEKNDLHICTHICLHTVTLCDFIILAA